MKRRGFATLVALLLIALVGMAAVAMSSRFSAEARRTRDARTDAQLRQLLLAAARHIQPGHWDANPALTIPGELAAQVKVNLTPGADHATATIEAQFDGRTMRQQLHWSKNSGQWMLHSAELAR